MPSALFINQTPVTKDAALRLSISIFLQLSAAKAIFISGELSGGRIFRRLLILCTRPCRASKCQGFCLAVFRCLFAFRREKRAKGSKPCLDSSLIPPLLRLITATILQRLFQQRLRERCNRQFIEICSDRTANWHCKSLLNLVPPNWADWHLCHQFWSALFFTRFFTHCFCKL